MAFSTAALITAVTAIRNSVKAIQLHSADPGNGAAANRSTAAPMAPVWGAVGASGTFALSSPLQFTGCGALAPITWISLWDNLNLAGANWYGNVQVTGDLTADSNGNYSLTALTINGAAA